jgi:hypothetical protein
LTGVAGSLRFLLAASLLGALVAAVSASAAPEQRARVLDRTVLCTVEPQGGIRELNLYGQSGVRATDDATKWASLPTAWFNNGSIWTAGLAGITAGRNDPSRHAGSGLWYDAKRCKSSRTRVVLTRGGLGSGGAASQLKERWECVSPKRVLIRIRGEFASPVRWRYIARQFRQFGASGPALRSAQLMATTPAGKPLAYADANESGRARLFFDGACLRGQAG